MRPLVGAGGGADEGATPAQSVENDDKTTNADPIALGSGAFELRQTDLSLPGAIRPLEFTRTYDSRSRHRSTLGSNWTHNWDVRVVPLNDYNRPSWVDPFCAGSPEETTCLMLHIGATERLFTLDVTIPYSEARLLAAAAGVERCSGGRNADGKDTGQRRSIPRRVRPA